MQPATQDGSCPVMRHLPTDGLPLRWLPGMDVGIPEPLLQFGQKPIRHTELLTAPAWRFLLLKAVSLVYAISRYAGSISLPIEFRPARRAASDVEPIPRKGSSTVSPAKENIRISLSANSSG